MPKINPKHKSRKKRKSVKSKENYQKKKEILSRHPLSNDDLFEMSKMLATSGRKYSVTLQLENFYKDAIQMVEGKKIENDRVIFQQEQFHQFISNFEKKISAEMISIVKPQTIDFFINEYYIKFHNLSLKTDKNVFYFGIKFLIRDIIFNSNYDDSLKNHEKLLTDKFCFKDFITFQEFCNVYLYLRILHNFADFVHTICIPYSLHKFQETELILDSDSFFKIIFENSVDFVNNLYEDNKIFQFRITNIGKPAWSSSSYLERMYFNMVFSSTDDILPNLDSIPVYFLYEPFKAFEKLLIKDYKINALDLTCLIGGFFNLFNELQKGMMKKGNRYFVFVVIASEKDLVKWYIPYVQKLYEAACIFLNKKPKARDFLSLAWDFLDKFSLNSSRLDIQKDLFSQNIVPFAIEYHKKQYFLSSVQFLSAFGELIHRYGNKSGKYANLKGRDFEKQVEIMLKSVIPQVCSRVKLENIEIGNKLGTDVDVAAFFEGMLFLIECKAYSRINYAKTLKIDEIEKNFEDLNGWLWDINNIALWCKKLENLEILIDKINSKFKKNEKIILKNIEYVIPCVVTIAPEFLIDTNSIGWLNFEMKIPRCCTMRELLNLFKFLVLEKKYQEDLKNSHFTIKIIPNTPVKI